MINIDAFDSNFQHWRVSMRKKFCIILPAALIFALPATASFADTSVDSTSMLRFSKENLPGFQKKQFIPFTQFLGVDSEKLGDGNLSIHLYGWGRADLADKESNNSADGSLTYGFLKYHFKEANAQVRLGRLFVNEGVANEHLDGISARTDLPFGFGISAFGGANVNTANMYGQKTDAKGDALFGGRLNYRYAGMFELGVSGVYETSAPKVNNQISRNSLLANSSVYGDHRVIGGDLWFTPHKMVELMGRSSYNTDTSGFSEHSYLLNVKPIKDLVITTEFNDYRDRNLFYSSYIFSTFLNNLNQNSRSYGGRSVYDLAKGIEVSADYKYHKRDIGTADRFGGDIRLAHLNNTLRTGLGYHYLRSGSNFATLPVPSASGSFHEVRGYAMHDTAKTYFASIDLTGFFFKNKADGRSTLWELYSSLGYHLTPALSLSGDIGYGRTPQYDEELKGLIRLTYNMNYDGKGGRK